MKNLLWVVGLSIFSFSMAIAAPSAKHDVAASTLKLQINGDPTTLDWNKQLDLHSERISYQVMEGLIAIDDKMKVQPALAESWTASKDSKTYTFKLKQGVKWTDGVELEAQHFIDSVQRVLDPATAASGGLLLYDIAGAEAYNKGDAKDFATVGISAPDKNTLVVRLRRPLANPPGVFDHPLAFPIRKGLIEKFKDQWTRPENFVTLGAYQLASWQPGDRLRLKANPTYHGRKPKHPEVEFLIIADEMAALRLFEAGQVDMMIGLPVLDLPRLAKSENFKVFEQVLNNYVGFNVTQAPFNDARVRRAFAYATDKEEIIKLLGGGKKAAKSWIHSKLSKSKPVIGIGYDVAKARKLLAEAGFPEGKGFPAFVFSTNTSDENRILAERLQSMWKTNLGVEASIEFETWKTYLAKVRSGNPPAIFRMGMGSTSFEQFDFAYAFVSTSPSNYGKWSNAKYDKLVSEASLKSPREVSVAERNYTLAQKVLIEEEAAIIPMFESALPILMNERFSGLRVNGRSKYQLKDL